MPTKTTLLRAALLRQGFRPTEHRSQRECLVGRHHASGAEIHLFLDKAGGARFSRDGSATRAVPVSSLAIDRLLAGEESKFFGPVKKEPTP